MEPYIFILIINLILSYIANICYDKKYKLVSVLSISILVLVNVIFSGCRDFYQIIEYGGHGAGCAIVGRTHAARSHVLSFAFGRDRSW